MIDLKVGDRVKLLGQVYEVDAAERTFANERSVALRQIDGPNRMELIGLEHPFAFFDRVDGVGQSEDDLSTIRGG